MEIIDKRSDNYVRIADLMVGDVFIRLKAGKQVGTYMKGTDVQGERVIIEFPEGTVYADYEDVKSEVVIGVTAALVIQE